MTTFGELQAAASLRAVVPQVFTAFASACALVVIGAAGASTSTPGGLVIASLNWLGAPVPGPLQAVPGWLAVRADAVTAVTAVAMVLGLLWSAAFLAKDRARWDKARGAPASWIGLTIVAEIHGSTTALGALGLTGAALVGVRVASAAQARRSAPYGPTIGPAGDAAGALLGGLTLVPFYLPLVVLHGLGGLPRSTHSQAHTARGEGAATASPADP